MEALGRCMLRQTHIVSTSEIQCGSLACNTYGFCFCLFTRSTVISRGQYDEPVYDMRERSLHQYSGGYQLMCFFLSYNVFSNI